MNKNTGWFLAGLAVLAYYSLSKSKTYPPAGPVQGPPDWHHFIDPTTGMYYNPLADPCYADGPVYDPAQCAQQGRSPYASEIGAGSINTGGHVLNI